MSFSSRPPLRDPLDGNVRTPGIAALVGFVRVWRTGCALRWEEISTGGAFEVFIVGGNVFDDEEEDVGG